MDRISKIVLIVLVNYLILLGCTLSTEPFDLEPVPRPKRLGVDEKSGLDMDHFHQSIKNHERDLGLCYGESLSGENKIQGKVVLELNIVPGGRIDGAMVNEPKSTLKDQKLHGCILKKVKTWSLPEPPRGEVVHIVYPLFFKTLE